MEKLTFDLKYRPRTINAMVGNDSTKALLKSLLTNQFPKFTIFTGPTGSGKTTAAFITAMTLLCEREGSEPCFECDKCKRLLNDLYGKGISSSSLGLFMYDMGLNSEQEYVNDIARGISLKPLKGNKVIILEELQRVKKDYQDALLRALEFIPDNTYVIITTSEVYKLANALKSRAIEVKFSYPTSNEMMDYARKICENEDLLLTNAELKEVINHYSNNPRKILKGLEAIKESDKVGLSTVIGDKREERLNCFKFFDTIYLGMEELLDFIDNISNKNDFIRSLRYIIKDTIRFRYKPITNISSEEREGFKKLGSNLTDKQMFELIDYLSSLPYTNEEDAETILLVISYKLSTKIQEDVVSDSLINIEQKGEDLDLDVSQLIGNLKFETNKVDIDDL